LFTDVFLVPGACIPGNKCLLKESVKDFCKKRQAENIVQSPIFNDFTISFIKGATDGSWGLPNPSSQINIELKISL
jgi:hypothetical protein